MATLRIAHQRRYPAPESRIERAAPGIRWQMVFAVLLWSLALLGARGMWMVIQFVFSGA